MAEPPFYLKQLELGPMQNFVYLIGDPATREAVVIDPGWEVPTILETLGADGYQLTKAIVTHHHFDHVQGLQALLKAKDLPVHAHQDDVPFLDLEPASLQPVSGGDTIRVGALAVTVLHTPGHTPGSQCLLINGRLFSGDTLFIRACGRWDLPGGDPSQLFHSLTGTLKGLPDETVLYPGHNYAEVPVSTMGQEKRQNPFLQERTEAQFLRQIGWA